MSRVRANDADHALAADELTLVAHPPDARSHLHGGSGRVRRKVGRIYCMGHVKGGKTFYADTQTGPEVLVSLKPLRPPSRALARPDRLRRQSPRPPRSR